MYYMRKGAICKAFGNEERLHIIACLRKPRCGKDLLARCSLSQSALSQHLKILREAGVVTARRSGKRIIYHADAKAASIVGLLLSYK